MRSYTHVAGAILFYIIFAFLLNLNHLIVGTFFAAWISLFPDIIDKLLDKHRGIGHSIFWLGPLFLVGFMELGNSSCTDNRIPFTYIPGYHHNSWYTLSVSIMENKFCMLK